MTGETTAAATAATISGFASGFMLDPATYMAGAARGFGGIDFYFAGRGGVLGDVPADVVTASLVFWHPEIVRPNWESSGPVMSRGEAAQAWADAAAAWADAHLVDDVDWARLAELTGSVVASASPVAAPIFAGWRGLPVPSEPKHAAMHHLNGLRELRMARHGAAVVALGLDPADAVRHRSPAMVAMQGWDEAPVSTEVVELWERAEVLTNQASAPDYAGLSAPDAADLVDLCTTASASVR